jgi:hypothetical protein
MYGEYILCELLRLPLDMQLVAVTTRRLLRALQLRLVSRPSHVSNSDIYVSTAPRNMQLVAVTTRHLPRALLQQLVSMPSYVTNSDAYASTATSIL